MNQSIIDAKKAVVTEIADKMKASQSTVVVEYRGLTVAEMTQLRRALREENIEFKIYKNSLTQHLCFALHLGNMIKCIAPLLSMVY